jgi:glycosyltransferase involved in cell wall biosynthesis
MKIIKGKHNHILYLSTFPPRECGIATFTNDLTTAIDHKFNPVVKSKIIAINAQSTSIYNYPVKVVDKLIATELENYVSLAKEINNRDDVKLVNIQHEFGLFGGNWGDYLIPFLQVLEKPVVVAFHSVLPDPDDDLRNLVRFIINRAKSTVIMNTISADILVDQYGVSREKLSIIPHGIPQTTFESSDRMKEVLGLSNRIVLSTFGMLSRNKGIEYAIRSLPEVVAKFPNVTYLVLGETHPVVQEHEGEVYRNFLNQEVAKLGLEDNVKFYNKYLSLDEIINFLKATDIYISPTVDRKQSVSGTLSYAMGCGRPVISTATAYAKYIVKPGQNGFLVKPKNSKDFSLAINKLLENEKLMKSMATEAYEQTRPMTWPNVAAAYFKLYKQFADLETEEKKLPEIKFDHLERLTDNFGVMHFAKYSEPDKRYGYSLDDNARALVIAARQYKSNPENKYLELMKTYLRFMRYVQRPNGGFSNIVSYKKQKDGTFDEDVQGRALWAVGYVSADSDVPGEIRLASSKIFDRGLKIADKLKSPRAIAFTMTGLYFYLKSHPNPKLVKLFRNLADKQVEAYEASASGDWHWFEDALTYSNSKLSESLYYAYELVGNPKYLEVANRTLDFLGQITYEKNHYSPIGQNGWYMRDSQRSYYDQQPEDTASMVETKVVAYKITKDKRHLDDAFTAFQWFLGKNHLGQMVYDEVTGGCYDGVGQHAINLNQGAESTISYLMARLVIDEVKES